MFGFLKNIDWSAFFASKAVWSGIATAIAGAASTTGHVIDPDQLNNTVIALEEIASDLTTVFGILTIVFRTKATTQIIKPSPDAPPQQLQPKQ
jgi:hypothetical protein